MRVNELAKQLGKSNKEVLDILQKQNQDVKTHSSNITEEQIQMVRRAAGEKAAGPDSKGAESQNGSQAEAPKKKIAAVYRPQNSQQRPARSKAQQGRAAAPGKAQGAARTLASGGAGSARTQGAQSQGAARPQASQGQAGSARTQTAQGRGLASGVVKTQTPQGQTASGASRPQGVLGAASGVSRPQSVQEQGAASLGSKPQSVQEQNGTSGAGKVSGAASGVSKPQSSQEQGTASGSGRSQGAAGIARTQNTQGQSPVSGAGKFQPAQGQDPAAEAGKSQPAQGQSSMTDPAKAQGSQSGSGAVRTQDQSLASGTVKPHTLQSQPQAAGGEKPAGAVRPQGASGQGAAGTGRSQSAQGQAGASGAVRGQAGQTNNGTRGTSYRDGGRPQGSGRGTGGSRDGGRGAGYSGNRDGNRSSGSFGGGARGGSARPGQRDSGSKSFDTPIQSKPTSSRKNNNNNYKNERYDKKNVNEDGPRSKGGKVSKHTLSMPQKTAQKQAEEVVKVITLPEVLTIKELADKMKMQPSVIIKKLFLQGQVVTVNSEIDFEKAEEIAMEYDVLCEKEEKIDVIAELLKEDEEDEADMIPRSPVVCVMGHVDHGKTSLLDAIRSTNVTSREAGGITQHIGAYTVEINEQQITFLDTPGHEAFTAMRMRGAQSTDIAILVVAADDGVMPQTVEAINHAKAAEVEIIVAINKIDKPSANIDRVKQELSEYELVPEDWGGSTIFVPVSAHTKEGIPELLEMILLAAEVKELKANPNRKARGLVIEAELDKGKGPVATILVQKGTLRVGDSVTAGACYGKVRAMMDDKGRRVKEAGPSQPVEILGLNDVPGAGDVLMATENEKEARSYAQTFITESKNKLLEDTKSRLSLDDLFSQIKAGNVKELPIIVKADVQGSVEAVKESLVKLSNEEVMVKVIHGGVGAINESDVTLASASNAIIIGFNVRPDVTAKSIAEREKVDLRLYRVIYQAIEDVEAAMKGMLDPVFEEQVIGHAVVRQLFKASGVGTIAGSYVTDGKFQRGCSCRITRGKDQIFEGALASLKRFKDDVKEVATGYECGLVFEKFNDLQEDDVIEAYIMVEVPR